MMRYYTYLNVKYGYVNNHGNDNDAWTFQYGSYIAYGIIKKFEVNTLQGNNIKHKWKENSKEHLWYKIAKIESYCNKD